MRRLIRNRPGTWLAVVVAVLGIALSACGGDSGGDGGEGSDGGTGLPATPGPVTPPDNNSGGGPAANDEYCDALMVALEEYSASAGSQGSFAETAEQFAAALRKVVPHAPDDVAGDLETFIGYYDRLATGGFEAVAEDSDDFMAATEGVFGPCAVMPPMPPVGS